MKMKALLNKKRLLIGIGTLIAVSAIPLIGGQPVLAQLQEVGEAIVEAIRRPEVKLTLEAEQKVMDADNQVSWKALEGKVKVAPGDTLCYVVSGENSGDIEAENLVITQPIPEQTTSVLYSASNNDDAAAAITYSIDNGESFVAEPMIEVTLPDGTVELQPAPAEAYTHVQWDFAESLASATEVDASYEVTID
ncbi:MAG: hypothetical protein WA865_07640 [Spirulinaceae cyanobacterium]